MPTDPGRGVDRQPRKPRPLPTPDPGFGKAPQQLISSAVKKQVAAEPKPSVLLNGWAVRRQRLLRARGFTGVVVDGIWGPVSQHAWQTYLHGPTVPPKPPVVKPAPVAAIHGPAAVVPERHNLVTGAATQRARHAIQLARADAKITAIQKQASDLGPAALDARRHAENILTDRKLALDHQLVAQPELIRAEAAKIRLSKTPQQMTAHDLLLTTVDPASGRFSPQHPAQVKTIQLWLQAHGHPHIAADGVYSKETNAALTDSLHRINAAERAHQEKLVGQRYTPAVVDRAARSLHLDVPRAPGALLDILQARTFTAQYLYGALERAVLADPNLGADPAYLKWRDTFIQKAAHQEQPWTPGFVKLSASALAVQSPVIAAVATSTDFADFKRKLHAAELKAEAAYLDQRQAAAQHHRGFWGTVGAGLAWLPAQTEQAAVFGYRSEKDLFTGKMLTNEADPMDEISRSHRTISEFHADHPWLSLLTDIAADPLNLIPGKVFLAPAIGVGRGSVALERVGFKLAENSGRIRYLPLTLTVPARTGRHVWGALDETAARVTAHLADQAMLPEWERQLTTRAITRTYIGAKHAAALKDDAMIAARKAVRDRVRQGFRPVRTTVAKGVAARTGRVFDDFSARLDANTLFSVSKTEKAVTDLLDTVLDGRLGKQIATWAKHGISLQAHDGVSVPSFVGHQLIGSLEERARVKLATDIAQSDARLTADRLYARSDPEWQATYERVTQKNLRRFGNHFRGGIDPVYDTALTDAVQGWRGRMMDSVLPVIQRRIEALAEQNGVKLWDEAGAWARPTVAASAGLEGSAHGAAIIDTMMSHATAAFQRYEQLNTDVANPLFGKFFDRADAELLMQHEIERRVSAVELRAQVRAAEGRAVADHLVQADIEAIHRDVIGNWKNQVEKWTDRTRWTDTRESVPAPFLYTRHLTDTPVLDPVETLFDTDPKLIDHLVGLAFREGSAPGPDATPFAQVLDLFRRSVTHHTEVLNEASAMLLQQKLRDEGLFWAAIRSKEAGPLRAILSTFEGATAGWKFLTLAIRPAWVVRNVADNTLKVLLQGVVDPRAWFSGAPVPGRATASIFDFGLTQMRETVSFIEKLHGGPMRATAAFDAALEKVWSLNDSTLQALFGLHGIAVPERLIREGRFGTEQGFKNRVWDLMGNRPEAYFKRVLYRDQYRKALARGLDDYAAAKYAWARVEKTLFDYSKISVVESNLSIFAPFIQFWRKNTTFWLKTFAEKPWFVADVGIYQEDLQKVHATWPEWMRRYIPLREAADLTASVPGLGWLTAYITDAGNSLYDPLNYFSFAPLYRTFKNENPFLAPDRKGWAFISPMIDSMNDWGLGINPFFRKPLEVAGVLNFRAWQSIFPETEFIQSMTREYANGLFGNDGLDLESWLIDPVLQALGQETTREWDRSNFDVYVNKEIAGQVARGEQPNRALAEKKIRQFLWVQTLLGFVGGVYQRRMTPQDFYIYQLVDAVHRGERDYANLSAQDKQLYKMFSLRKADPVTFDRYTEAAPLIDAYYKLQDFQAREQWKQEHPEIIPFVEPAFSKTLPRARFATTQRLVTETALAFQQSDFARAAGIDPLARRAAESLYADAELRAFWAKNDTPRELRDRMLRGVWNDHLRRLNETFFAIPATDYAAKSAFLDQHPVLWDHWQQNNTAADDLSSISHFSNAALRERYFEFLDAKDYGSAHDFLRQFPFIFEDTSAADRVDPNTGEWKYGHGGTPHSAKARAYLSAKAGLDYVFKTLNNWPARSRFLVSDDPRAVAARNFLATYDGWQTRNGRFAPASFWTGKHGHGMTQHAKDYVAVKGVIGWWFNLLKADKQAAQKWLDSDAKGAKELRAYFKKWASKGGMTEHAKAYLDAKAALDRYFAVNKADRKHWLAQHPHDAHVVLGYFKKWGHQSAKERAWKKDGAWMMSVNPELNQRLAFWRGYWQLSPAQRPAYVQANASSDGVFIYGILGDTERHDAEQRYLREAVAHGIKSKETALYLRAKPLLDIYFTLAPSDRTLFARANPEVQQYLDAYANHKLTGNKKLDAKIEAYFKLPDKSNARSDYLHAHPDVQRYFNQHSTPAERAMRGLINVYFSLPFRDRNWFALKHPELQAYFDSRRLQAQNEQAAALAFDQADPRLAKLFKLAQTDIAQPEQNLLQSMRLHSKEKVDTLDVRTTRRPLKQ